MNTAPLLFAMSAAFALATSAVAAPKLPPLPRLMTERGVLSLPAARPTQTLSYGESELQKIELFLPARRESERRHPVVVLISGNCWAGGERMQQIMRPVAGALVGKGYAVWLVGIRGIDDEGGGYPGSFNDLATAIDRIVEDADEFNLDPDRVVLFGHGSGAHLALWAAGRRNIAKDSPLAANPPLQPRGVLAAAGFEALGKWQPAIAASCGAETLTKLTTSASGDDSPASESRMADISPERLLPTQVPSVALHGIYDDVAFPAIGLDYATAARRAGDAADLQVAPVAGRFEVIAPGTAAFSQALAVIERFLR